MTNVNQITCKHGACYNTDYTLDGITLGAPFPMDLAEKAMKFQFTIDDVIVASYPSSGEAFIYEIVWLLMNEGDIESATNIPLGQRLPLLELIGLEGYKSDSMIERIRAKDAGRAMCTHMPYSLIGPALEKGKPKIIIVIRDPKELVLSLYCSYRRWPGRELPSFTYFFETFYKTGRLLFGDHIDHLLGYWDQVKEMNMLVIRYGEILEDVEDTVLKISNYLEKDLTPKQIHSIVKYMTVQTSENGYKPPIIDTVLGVRLFEADLGDFAEQQPELSEEEKGKTESMQVEIHQGDNKKGVVDSQSQSGSEVWAAIPPMEVEIVCAQEPLQLSPEQAEYISEQLKARLEPVGLFF